MEGGEEEETKGVRDAPKIVELLGGKGGGGGGGGGKAPDSHMVTVDLDVDSGS